jgi:hypothetical protein
MSIDRGMRQHRRERRGIDMTASRPKAKSCSPVFGTAPRTVPCGFGPPGLSLSLCRPAKSKLADPDEPRLATALPHTGTNSGPEVKARRAACRPGGEWRHRLPAQCGAAGLAPQPGNAGNGAASCTGQSVARDPRSEWRCRRIDTWYESEHLESDRPTCCSLPREAMAGCLRLRRVVQSGREPGKTLASAIDRFDG